MAVSAAAGRRLAAVDASAKGGLLAHFEMMALATVLGETRSASPLLLRARALGLGTLHQLLGVAVARGCRHYAAPSGAEAVRDPGREAIALSGTARHSRRPTSVWLRPQR